MNHLYQELARSHEQELLTEAARRRVAAVARKARQPRPAQAGASSLRRELGWVVIGLAALAA